MEGKQTVSYLGLIQELRSVVESQVKIAADAMAENFPPFFDRNVRELVVAGLAEVQADEGTVWLMDEEKECLIPCFNSGARASEFVGRFRQSLRSGMISMVVATEQPICENEVKANKTQDRALDSQLGVETCAMIAVPFYFAGELRGVLSGVQLRKAGDDLPPPGGFNWNDLQTLQRTATLLGRLLEHKLLTRLLGLELSA